MNESQILSLIVDHRREQAEYRREQDEFRKEQDESLAELRRGQAEIIRELDELRRGRAEIIKNYALILERLDTQHKIVVDKLNPLAPR